MAFTDLACRLKNFKAYLNPKSMELGFGFLHLVLFCHFA